MNIFMEAQAMGTRMDKEKRAHRNTVEQLVGPDHDDFWRSRVWWIGQYRKQHKTTIKASIAAWERLSGVDFHFGKRQCS